jgi:hypothetical protein
MTTRVARKSFERGSWKRDLARERRGEEGAKRIRCRVVAVPDDAGRALLKYVLRPPVANDRLTFTSDHKVPSSASSPMAPLPSTSTPWLCSSASPPPFPPPGSTPSTTPASSPPPLRSARGSSRRRRHPRTPRPGPSCRRHHDQDLAERGQRRLRRVLILAAPADRARVPGSGRRPVPPCWSECDGHSWCFAGIKELCVASCSECGVGQ